MSGGSQIHIFFGAPILPTPKEAKFSGGVIETWEKQCFSFRKKSGNLCPRKRRSSDLVHQMHDDDDILDYDFRNQLTNFGRKCELTGVSLTDRAAHIGNLKLLPSKTRVIDDSTDNISQVYEDESTKIHTKHLLSEKDAKIKTGKETNKPEETERNASCAAFNHHAIRRCMISVRQNDKQSNLQSNQLVGHSLEKSPQIMKIDKPGISTDPEFLNGFTSNRTVFSSNHALGQNEIQSKSPLLKRTQGLHKADEQAADLHIRCHESSGVYYTNVAEKDFNQNYNSSLELFGSGSSVKNNSSLRENFQDGVENNFQKNASVYVDFIPPTDGYIEPWKKEIFCSRESHSDKISQVLEGTFLAAANAAVGDRRQSIKPSVSSSPLCSIRQIEPSVISGPKVQRHPSLLKDCLCKGQKYTILVTVLHPCHIKEIQMKSQSKLSSKVPLSTLVVFDQSEVKQKIMLWRTAAFWSLTVFPGDIILLTDVVIYENRWIGEMMLQSTWTSQLLNLGSCSSIGQNELSCVVDVNALQDLIQYISLKYAYLQDLPQRQKQTLTNVHHVRLDQLKPDTLLHSVVKIIDILVLTESTYSHKGEKETKIILTVKQVKDQHCALILWGALTSCYPRLLKKKDYIWEFKYLFAKHNPVSGELELHTTPWSSMTCLFNDDKRAVEFREKFEKSKLLVKRTSLSTHLEDKCSGLIQVKAHVSELKFSVAPFSSGQLIFDARTSLLHIFASLELMIYTGCAKCGLELQMDDNKIYKQCVSCLPFNKLKTFYRPALMTVQDEGNQISVWVMPKLMEKMFLNIPAECLNKTIEPSIDATYGMIVADLCHSLLTDKKAYYLLTIRSQFLLDENSCPLEKNFCLLDFHLDL